MGGKATVLNERERRKRDKRKRESNQKPCAVHDESMSGLQSKVNRQTNTQKREEEKKESERHVTCAKAVKDK